MSMPNVNATGRINEGAPQIRQAAAEASRINPTPNQTESPGFVARHPRVMAGL